MLLVGCGATVHRAGTEQLLTSDAVDQSVSKLDFTILAGRTVYFDTKFLRNVKGIGFVNSDYIVSSIRQQLVSAGCLLSEIRDEADYIVEARVGALGSDSHEVTYGIPASNALNSAATLLASAPALPSVPEVSIAKRNAQTATVKIAAFAYHRESQAPVWQSGLAESRSSARDTWLFGAGPFQQGTIYDGTRFAGSRLNWGISGRPETKEPEAEQYSSTRIFTAPAVLERGLKAENERVVHAGHEEGDTEEGGG